MQHIADIFNNYLPCDVTIYTEHGDVAIDLKDKETGEVLAGYYFNAEDMAKPKPKYIAEVHENGGITQGDISTNLLIDTIKRAVIDFDYKFPYPASGIIFYDGQRITQEQFNQIARGMK